MWVRQAVRSAPRAGAVALATATLAAGALGAATASAATADAGTGPGIGHTDDIARRAQAQPAPREQPGEPVRREGAPGQLAKSGSDSDTMLYAGLAISLCTLGALTVAGARSRRDQSPPATRSPAVRLSPRPRG